MNTNMDSLNRIELEDLPTHNTEQDNINYQQEIESIQKEKVERKQLVTKTAKDFVNIGHVYKILEVMTTNPHKKYFTKLEATTYYPGYTLFHYLGDFLLQVMIKKGWIVKIQLPTHQHIIHMEHEEKFDLLDDINKNRRRAKKSGIAYYRVSETGIKVKNILNKIVEDFINPDGELDNIYLKAKQMKK